jgi:hypothetical protein
MATWRHLTFMEEIPSIDHKLKKTKRDKYYQEDDIKWQNLN